MVIPLKMLLIGIDPYPNQQRVVNLRQTGQILQAAEASNPGGSTRGLGVLHNESIPAC